MKKIPISKYLRNSSPELHHLCVSKLNMGLAQGEVTFDCRPFRMVKNISDKLSSTKTWAA